MYDCNTDSKMGNYNALLFLTLPSQDALLAAYLTQAMQLHRNASNRHVLVGRTCLLLQQAPLDYLTFFSTPFFGVNLLFLALLKARSKEKTLNLFSILLSLHIQAQKIHLTIIWCWQEDCNLFCLKLSKYNNM